MINIFLMKIFNFFSAANYVGIRREIGDWKYQRTGRAIFRWALLAWKVGPGQLDLNRLFFLLRWNISVNLKQDLKWEAFFFFWFLRRLKWFFFCVVNVPVPKSKLTDKWKKVVLPLLVFSYCVVVWFFTPYTSGHDYLEAERARGLMSTHWNTVWSNRQ